MLKIKKNLKAQKNKTKTTMKNTEEKNHFKCSV